MIAIRFDHVTKSFSHHAGQMLLRDRLRDLVRRTHRTRFEALKNVSFEVETGESVAIIGPNGSGKSTILNLATGLARPDVGSVRVDGKVSALLELGAGFHPDLTGAENVRVNAALMGLSRAQTRQRFEGIVDFSGIGDFIDEPMRTYSSGMTMRLAFSVAVSVDPDVLVVDEVIGVGDQAFYAQCVEKMRSFQRAGKTILLATHSVELVTKFCQRALWLDHGNVVAQGLAREVIAAYKGSVPASP